MTRTNGLDRGVAGDPALALASQPNLLPTLFDRMPMGVAIFDRNLRIVRCNPTWAEFIERYATARARDVVPGAAFFDLAPGTEAAVMPAFARALAGETVRQEGLRLESAGIASYWDVVLTPLVEGGDVVGFIDIVTDATARIRAESELAARARQQATIAALGQRALADADLAALFDFSIAQIVATLGVACGSIMELSADGTSLLLRAGVGWQPGLVGGLRLSADGGTQSARTLNAGAPLISEDLRADARFTDVAVLRAHGVVSGVSVVIRGLDCPFGVIGAYSTGPRAFSQDDVHFLEAAANVLAVAVERARIEDELRERETQYRGIFEATSDGLIVNDLETGAVVEANPAFCAMHGYACEELIGADPRTFVHPDHHPAFADYLAAARAGSTFRTRAVDVRKDGSRFPVEVHGSRYMYHGRPHVLGAVRDISDRVEAYELLEQRVADRTRELRLLLDISHDVAGTLELRPLVRVILDRVKGVVDYTGAAIFTLDASGDYLDLLLYQGPIPQHTLNYRWALANSDYAREVIRTGAPVIIPNVFADTPLARNFREKAVRDIGEVRRDFGAWMGVPLTLGERVVGLLAVEIAQTGYYTERHAELLRAVADQAAVAVENARLYEQARGIAALEERQRLARELHDSVSQALYGISLGARTARTLLDRDPGRVAEPLDYVLSLAEAGLTEMRALIFALRPESLEQEGLVVALEKQAAALRARHGLAVVAELGTEPDAPLAVKEALARIAQEAMHNVVKHANASEVTLRLAQSPDEIVFDLHDNGAGFDASQSFPGHLGLRSMRERAARFRGALAIESEPDRGTRLRVVIPSAWDMMASNAVPRP